MRVIVQLCFCSSSSSLIAIKAVLNNADILSRLLLFAMMIYVFATQWVTDAQQRSTKKRLLLQKAVVCLQDPPFPPEKGKVLKSWQSSKDNCLYACFCCPLFVQSVFFSSTCCFVCEAESVDGCYKRSIHVWLHETTFPRTKRWKCRSAHLTGLLKDKNKLFTLCLKKDGSGEWKRKSVKNRVNSFFFFSPTCGLCCVSVVASLQKAEKRRIYSQDIYGGKIRTLHSFSLFVVTVKCSKYPLNPPSIIILLGGKGRVNPSACIRASKTFTQIKVACLLHFFQL